MVALLNSFLQGTLGKEVQQQFQNGRRQVKMKLTLLSPERKKMPKMENDAKKPVSTTTNSSEIFSASDRISHEFRGNRSHAVLKGLMESCFTSRREWITSECPTIVQIVELFPLFSHDKSVNACLIIIKCTYKTILFYIGTL